MSQTLLGSICLSDIPTEKVTTSEKNGKTYLSVVIFVNDEVDKYNNIASMAVSQSKEEREAKAKAKYIGNFKDSKSIVRAVAPTEALEEPLPF